MTQSQRASQHEARPHRRSVAAVAVAFLAAGVTMASTVSRMPEIKTQVGASATELAFALVCVGIGSIVAMPFAGRLTGRFGTASITGIFTTIAVIGWSLIPLAHSVAELAGILFITGLGIGTWDVAMNVQGSFVERARRQVLMPLWHGLFSVGGVVGALAGAGAAKWGVPLAWQIIAICVVLWIAVLVSLPSFLPNPPDDDTEGETSSETADDATNPAQTDAAAAAPPARSKPRRGVTQAEILLGLIMLSTAIGEGAANDWLAVALVDERHAPAAIGALTYAGFNLTMAIGRFSGAPLIARFGRVASLRTAGTIAGLGVLLLCLVPGTGTALVGAAAWGLGFAIVFPSAVSAAGEIPGRAGRAIANVSTIGYAGFLFGAPMIGTLAHAVPLLDALLVVVAFAALIVILAPAARERRRATRTIAGS